MLDAAWQTIGDDLGLQPADPIRVEILGAPADLAKMSPLTEAEIETTGTIALSKYNKLMVVSPRATLFGYPWMDTLAHEYTHLVVVADLARHGAGVAAGRPRAVRADALARGRPRSCCRRPSKRCSPRACARAG